MKVMSNSSFDFLVSRTLIYLKKAGDSVLTVNILVIKDQMIGMCQEASESGCSLK